MHKQLTPYHTTFGTLMTRLVLLFACLAFFNVAVVVATTQTKTLPRDPCVVNATSPYTADPSEEGFVNRICEEAVAGDPSFNYSDCIMFMHSLHVPFTKEAKEQEACAHPMCKHAWPLIHGH